MPDPETSVQDMAPCDTLPDTVVVAWAVAFVF